MTGVTPAGPGLRPGGLSRDASQAKPLVPNAAMERGARAMLALLRMQSSLLVGVVIPSFIMLCWLIVYVGTVNFPTWIPLWLGALVHLSVWAVVTYKLYLAACVGPSLRKARGQ